MKGLQTKNNEKYYVLAQVHTLSLRRNLA